jgi:hypothetical protein
MAEPAGADSRPTRSLAAILVLAVVILVGLEFRSAGSNDDLAHPPGGEAGGPLGHAFGTDKSLSHAAATRPHGVSGSGSGGTAAAESGMGGFTFPPHIKDVIINIGSFRDPPIPPNDETFVLAVEPILRTAASIPPMKNRYVITAALSATRGFSQMQFLNGGMSSSLSKPLGDFGSELPEGQQPFALVPVLTLADLLRAVPRDVDIVEVIIDAQGHDLAIVKSAGEDIKRVKKLIAEVYCNGLV